MESRPSQLSHLTSAYFSQILQSVRQSARGITPTHYLRQPSNHNEVNVRYIVRVIGTGLGYINF